MSVNILPTNPYHTYTTDYIQSLQVQVDKKIASHINRKMASDKNDLGLQFNSEDYWELAIYNEILEQIKYCNSCFEDFDIDDIVSSIKNELV